MVILKYSDEILENYHADSKVAVYYRIQNDAELEYKLYEIAKF